MIVKFILIVAMVIDYIQLLAKPHSLYDKECQPLDRRNHWLAFKAAVVFLFVANLLSDVQLTIPSLLSMSAHLHDSFFEAASSIS